MTMPELLVSRELAWALVWLAGAVATDMVAIPALVMSHGFRRLAWAALSIAAIFASFFCMRRVVTVIPLGVAYALWCVFGIYGTLAIRSGQALRPQLTQASRLLPWRRRKHRAAWGRRVLLPESSLPRSVL